MTHDRVAAGPAAALQAPNSATSQQEGGPPASLMGRRLLTATTPVGIRLDFWLDVVILVSFIVAYSYGFTGDVIHEWLGLALGLVLLVHLTRHWDWVVRTTRKLFGRRGHDRVIWLVNLALLFSMTLCIGSGIVISRVALPSLGFFLASNLFWNRLHILTAEITLGLVPVHAALRWRWIAGVGRRLLTRRTGGPGQGRR
jgi:hypothetical protein